MLSVCKDHLEQREREIKVTRSELEESGAILVDRLVITTELQRTNELLSVQLKQALLEKEVSAVAYKHLLPVEPAGEKAVFYVPSLDLWQEALSHLQSSRASEQQAQQGLLKVNEEKKTLENSARDLQLAKKSALEECQDLIRSSEWQAKELREVLGL
jgi:hypothetical protein